MEHEGSILYAPVNALWHSAQHRFAWDIPDHVIMSALVLLISCVVFPLASRRLRKDDPGIIQHLLELTVGGEPQTLPVDHVVICAGQEPLRELHDQLQAAGHKVHLIGGADKAAELDAKRAIAQGTTLAATL